ncbi:MazG-like family protein [Streptomyces olivoreticuli]
MEHCKPMDQTPWDTVSRLVDWLDSESQLPPDMVRILRVLKISEENGEAAEAVHGVMGSNPRKGTSHTWEDVQREVCDVILTGMVALKTLSPDAEKVFNEHLSSVADRSLSG